MHLTRDQCRLTLHWFWHRQINRSNNGTHQKGSLCTNIKKKYTTQNKVTVYISPLCSCTVCMYIYNFTCVAIYITVTLYSQIELMLRTVTYLSSTYVQSNTVQVPEYVLPKYILKSSGAFNDIWQFKKKKKKNVYHSSLGGFNGSRRRSGSTTG